MFQKRLFLLSTALIFSNISNSQIDIRPKKHSHSQTLISIYQKSISNQLSGNCTSYPTCSAYARQAYSEYSPARATLLACDRLIRCGNDHNLPIVRISGIPYAYDPLDYGLRIFNSKPQSDSLLRCLDSSKLTTLRFLSSKKDTNTPIAFLSNILTQRLSRNCRNDLNVELSKLFRRNGDPDAMIDSLRPAHNSGHVSSSEELVKIYLEIGNFQQASVIAASMPASDSPIQKVCRVLNSDFGDPKITFDSSRLLQDYERLLSKKPNLAAILSIVPGGGYFYAGQPESAVSAILLTSIFGSLAREAYKKEMPVLTGISIAIGGSFYLGGIVGSKRSMIRYRDTLRQKIVDDYLNKNY